MSEYIANPAVLAAIVGGLAGILGGLIASLANNLWTAWTGRWELRRSLYVQLLTSLGMAEQALSILSYWEEQRDPSDSSGVREQIEEVSGRYTRQLSRASGVIARTASVAALTLPPPAVSALQTYLDGEKKAQRASDFYEHLDIRLAAARAAQEALVNAGKTDLGL